MLFLTTHGPVIINILLDLSRNLNDNVLFFRIELSECLDFVEDWFLGSWLGLAIFIDILILIVRDGLASFASALAVHVDFVLFEVIGLFGFPLRLRVSNKVFTALLTVLFAFNFLLSIFSLLSLNNLAAGDIELTTFNSCLEPLEKLS